ncbi:Rha family transcriptional regulator [Virgibacillus salexigens]|uniref:Rha family transcriptional regulator n=1 Tax=Virgibacillus salexigens TaxID=61016 RepID=UPI003081FF78
MNQLKVISFDGQLVTDSREVAEMVGKSHDQLMRSIRTYISYLDSAKMQSENFFIDSSYKNSQNKIMPCYLLTRKGCDMVANKMTGSKGVQFTAEYVTRFEEMEKEISKPTNNTKLLLETALKHEEKIETIASDVNYLKDTMRIDGAQEHALNKKGKRVVVESLGGKGSPAYKQMAFKVFSAFWRDFKNHFEIPRYGDLPKKRYEDGLRFIGMWQPSTSLKIDIDETNNQQTLEGVI